ncbi:MAG: phage antirepressor [Alphaproteobacteria bacterium]|nr:phage antirepressor [Alphaproteobacteria bacterium]MBR2137540.1 phage antirepressor [Alphaproteobacteria bacterium]
MKNNNNKLQIFNYENTKVRTVVKDDEIWWVLKDVCDVLGLSNSRKVAERLDDDEKGVTLSDTLGGTQKTTIINESGLYKVILRSDKPEAKKFMNWVTHEVLPSIRKHGAYITSEKMEKLMSDPDTWITLITTLKKEREQNQVLQSKLTQHNNKVLFADAVAASDDTLLIGEFAKILKANGINVGRKKLFDLLRMHGFLIKRPGSEYNMPTQRAMDLTLFKIKENVILHPDGRTTISKTTKITGKGQQYLLKYFLKNLNADTTRELF